MAKIEHCNEKGEKIFDLDNLKNSLRKNGRKDKPGSACCPVYPNTHSLNAAAVSAIWAFPVSAPDIRRTSTGRTAHRFAGRGFC